MHHVEHARRHASPWKASAIAPPTRARTACTMVLPQISAGAAFQVSEDGQVQGRCWQPRPVVCAVKPISSLPSGGWVSQNCRARSCPGRQSCGSWRCRGRRRACAPAPPGVGVGHLGLQKLVEAPGNDVGHAVQRLGALFPLVRPQAHPARGAARTARSTRAASACAPCSTLPSIGPTLSKVCRFLRIRHSHSWRAQRGGQCEDVQDASRVVRSHLPVTSDNAQINAPTQIVQRLSY